MTGNILVVHEFDIIIGNAEYKDSAEYKYLPKKYFDELLYFVKEFTAEEDIDATQFMKVGFRKGVKDTIKINNYVGLIELPSGFQIEILPKVEFKEKYTKENRTKKVFLKMLQSLKNFNGKAFTNAFLKADRMNLYEIFINMYIQEVKILVKHGIKSSYNMIEDNLTFYKGKLNVKQNIKYNLAHKERFYVLYNEYSVNRPENRLIKSTLLKIMKNSTSNENIREIRRLLISFELVEESNNYDNDFASIVKERNMRDYDTLMMWSKIFLYNKSFTTFSGETTGKALLFPMEKLFEGYVAKWVRKVFGNSGCEVSTQDKGYNLFDSPRCFSLRPDIVIKQDNQTIIMDTKWKQLADGVNNYGISQTDMYQMYVYSKKYMQLGKTAPEVWLLYPLCDNSEKIGNPEFYSDDGVRVHIYFVDVEDIEGSINELMSMCFYNASKSNENP